MTPDPPEVEMSLHSGDRCDRCRSETVPVVVDAGAGADLPLFVIGQKTPPAAGEVVQVLRQTLRGRLCLHCGLLTAQARLAHEDLADYRGKTRQSAPAALSDRTLLSPRAPTWVKRPRDE